MAYQQTTLLALKRAELDDIAVKEFGLNPGDYKNRTELITIILNKQKADLEAKGQEIAKEMAKAPDPVAPLIEARKEATIEAKEMAKAGAKPKHPFSLKTAERNIEFYLHKGPRYWPVAENIIRKWGGQGKIDGAKWMAKLSKAKAEWGELRAKGKVHMPFFQPAKTKIIGKKARTR